jgi:hypothetical protein
MTDNEELGSIASSVTPSDANLEKVVTGASEAAGVAFSAAAVEKFKHDKDSGDHPSAGTPLALDATAAALLFEPTVLGAKGLTVEDSGVTSADVESAAGKLTGADAAAAKTEVEKLAG